MIDGQRLTAWFSENARPLPWRTATRDPYHVLVSELMAQQTQLDRVVPRFEAFVVRFPTIRDLAAATEDEVLELWSGLGYYRRARLLHRLAREVAAAGGELPLSAAELEKLPGVGPYTAAAVASTVFGEAVPLMDGNVARVGARVLARAEDPRTKAGRTVILEWVRTLMAGAPPGEVNEALMELGATICTPAEPECGLCPLAESCRGRREGDPTAYPPPRRARQIIEVRWLALVVEDPDGRWLLRRVAEGPILNGLWLPPFTEIDEDRPVDEQVLGMAPFEIHAPVKFTDPIKHSITHRRIEVSPARVRIDHSARLPEGWSWADPARPGQPTSSLLEKLRRAFSDA